MNKNYNQSSSHSKRNANVKKKPFQKQAYRYHTRNKAPKKPVIKVKKIFNNEVKDKTLLYRKPLSIEALADLLNINLGEIVKYFFLKQIIVRAQTILNEEQIEEICLEFNFDFKNEYQVESAAAKNVLNIKQQTQIKNAESIFKTPVVTIMGHVDHGKTTLLDVIRKSHLINKEYGGITQTIGAYSVYLPKRKKNITFIDTPGHVAFTGMRARGSLITDIIIIVVAADDGIKSQTIESINHALSAKIPIIIFVNKMDRPNTNLDRILVELSQNGIITEQMGGTIPLITGSALKNQNISSLLDMILLISELQELTYQKDVPANGVVIESGLNKQVGITTSLLIQNGTLHLKDIIVTENTYGKVKIMQNENQQKLTEVAAGFPVSIIGLHEMSQAGEKFFVVESEKAAQEIIKKKSDFQKNMPADMKLSDLNRKIKLNQQQTVNLIIKASNQGMLEALNYMLDKLKDKWKSINFNVIHSGVGSINEPDVMLAVASENAIILGYQVTTSLLIQNLIKKYQINFFNSNIIYEIIDYIKQYLDDNIDKEKIETIVGEAIVKKIFVFSKTKKIAGCLIKSGTVNEDNPVRIYRDQKLIYSGKLLSIFHFQNKVKSAYEGEEYGFSIEKFNDLKENDIIQAVTITEKK